MIRKISVASFNHSVFSWKKQTWEMPHLSSVEHEMPPHSHPASSQLPIRDIDTDRIDTDTTDAWTVDLTDDLTDDLDRYHPGISDIGDTLRLDDTIGRPEDPTINPQIDPKIDTDSGDNTVIQDPQGRDPVSQMSVEQWLESLRRNDRTFYNMMAMEVWSIAKSMDTLLPGFWSKFMENRRLAVQNFVIQRRTEKGTGLRLEDLGDPTKEPPTTSNQELN